MPEIEKKSIKILPSRGRPTNYPPLPPQYLKSTCEKRRDTLVDPCSQCSCQCHRKSSKDLKHSMPNRSSCRSKHEDRADREVGCPQDRYYDSQGVDSRRDFRDYESERDEKRHSCSRSRGEKIEENDFNGGAGRAKCCNGAERHGQKDRFDAQPLNSSGCCRSRNVGPGSNIDCPRLREKSTEACTCNRLTSRRPKTDCRTFAGKVECDRRPRTVDTGVSISGCHPTRSSSGYRRSASDNCASQRCKLDGAEEPSRRCCRSNDASRGQESSLPTGTGTKCTSRQSHKCRVSRNTPLPAVHENLGGGMNCRRCDRKVYHAEMQLVSGEAYHRICFSCFCCRKPLEPFTYEEHCREIFCKQCYTRNFGPQGYGYGTGAGVLQTPL